MSKKINQNAGCFECDSVDFIHGDFICTDTNERVVHCECSRKFDNGSIKNNLELKIKVLKYYFDKGFVSKSMLPEKVQYINQMDRIQENVWYFNSTFLDVEGFIIQHEGKYYGFDLGQSLATENLMHQRFLIDFIPYYISHEYHDTLVDNSWFMEQKFDNMTSKEIFDKLFDGINLDFERYNFKK